MPELPEVEIVCRNLSEMIKPPQKIQSWVFWRKDLRFVFPVQELRALQGQKILHIRRRAKYILFEFADFFVISHLGMTGQWKKWAGPMTTYVRRKHDHVGLQLSEKLSLVYEDPRRFGFLQVVAKADLTKYFSKVGPEPLEAATDFESLTKVFKKKNAPVKQVLMDQKYLVGVGNIYASEALFRAGINPFQKASRVKAEKYEKLWLEVRLVLKAAIDLGGSTIQNYRNANDEPGGFQTAFLVYGREGLLCLRCKKNLIQAAKISGRATFWCKACQKS